MIRIITGKPRNGKTLWVISEIDRYHKLHPDKPVFCNVKGLRDTTPYIQPLPDDWRSTPFGSLVIYDEAQDFPQWKATGRQGPSEFEQCDVLTTHGHTEHDLWFITQDPTLIHHHVRKLCNEHIHVRRVMGTNNATLFKWSEHCEIKLDDYHSIQRADQTLWPYDKALFDRYISATGHSVSWRLPRKVIIVGLAALCGLGVILYLIFSGKLFFFGGGEGASVDPVTGLPKKSSFLGLGDDDGLTYEQRFKPEIAHMPWTAPAYKDREPVSIPRILCISTADRCRCYTEQVTLLTVDNDRCRDIARNGIYNPFLPPIESSISSSSASSNLTSSASSSASSFSPSSASSLSSPSSFQVIRAPRPAL